MIGIVVVSHSPALAGAAVALALEMAGATPPVIVIAAGASDGVTGTDAVKVAAAIDEAASPDGVLVFMDLGSAVLSASMALEFVESTVEVRLSGAPFVEGIVAGVVLASAGASLDEADREASGAMIAKNAQLEPAGGGGAESSTSPDVSERSLDVTLINPLGLHARPAAAIVAALAKVDATVTVSVAGGNAVSTRSLMGLMALGAQKGTVLHIKASGPDAATAVETIRTMAENGFGEMEG